MTYDPIGFNTTSMMQNNRWLALDIAEQNHLRYIELAAGRNPRSMLSSLRDPAELKNVKEKLKLHDLSVHCIGAHRSLDRSEELEELCVLMEKACELHCPVVMTAVPDGSSQEGYREGLEKAAKRAKELGISLCLENHGYEHGSGTSLLPLVSSYGNEVMLCYDTGNVFYYSQEDFIKDIQCCQHKIRHFHLKDKLGGMGEWHFPALGEGIVPFPVLQATDHPVSCSIEIEFTPLGATCEEISQALKKSLRYLSGGS